MIQISWADIYAVFACHHLICHPNLIFNMAYSIWHADRRAISGMRFTPLDRRRPSRPYVGVGITDEKAYKVCQSCMAIINRLAITVTTHLLDCRCAESEKHTEMLSLVA